MNVWLYEPVELSPSYHHITVLARCGHHLLAGYGCKERGGRTSAASQASAPVILTHGKRLQPQAIATVVRQELDGSALSRICTPDLAQRLL